jgi:hypothetical protein
MGVPLRWATADRKEVGGGGLAGVAEGGTAAVVFRVGREAEVIEADGETGDVIDDVGASTLSPNLLQTMLCRGGARTT